MSESEMFDCPACAGPFALGGSCVTCFGKTIVNQDQINDFYDRQKKHKDSELFKEITSAFEKFVEGVEEDVVIYISKNKTLLVQVAEDEFELDKVSGMWKII